MEIKQFNWREEMETGKLEKLRDQFAMAALQGMVSDSNVNWANVPGGGIDFMKNNCEWCYKVADAMLEARGGE